VAPIDVQEPPLRVLALPCRRVAAGAAAAGDGGGSGDDDEQAAANALHSVYCSRWLGAATCSTLIDAIEAHAAAATARCSHAAGAAGGGWSTARHANFATTDIELSCAPTLRQWLAPQLAHAVLPCMARKFGVPRDRLRVRELFAVKYQGPCAGGAEARGPAAGPADARQPPPCAGSISSSPPQAELAAHRDGTLLSFNVLLSDPGAFEGGGTHFKTLGTTVRPRHAGDLVMHCGHMLHGASPVTSGVRYIIVGFVDAIRAPACSLAQAAPAAEEADDYCSSRVDAGTVAAIARAAASAAADRARCYEWARAPPGLSVEDADYAVLGSDWQMLQGK
jgi:hypothetical protein